MGLKQLTNKDRKLKDKVESLQMAIFDLQKEMKKDGLTEGKVNEALNAPKKFTVKKKIRVDGNIYNPGIYILKKKKAGGGIYLNTSNNEMLGAYTGTLQAANSGFFLEGKLTEDAVASFTKELNGERIKAKVYNKIFQMIPAKPQPENKK